MRRFQIYLDTSVLNFFFEKEDQEKVNSTRELFQEIRRGRFLAYISDLVLREIDKASAGKKLNLLSLARSYDLPILELTPECLLLAEKYMARKIFPAKYRDDALHVAAAAVHRMDIVVTWNLRHIIKIRTKREVKAVNLFEGYPEIEICTPLEVIEND